MYFHEYETQWAKSRRENRRLFSDMIASSGETAARNAFYYTSVDNAVYDSPSNFTVGAASTLGGVEQAWYTVGRPYYRLYPDYVKIFERTSLDFPVRYFEVPYRSFVIRFARGQEPRIGGVPVGSLLVSKMTFSDCVRAVLTQPDGTLHPDVNRVLDTDPDWAARGDRLVISPSYIWPPAGNAPAVMTVELDNPDISVDQSIEEGRFGRRARPELDRPDIDLDDLLRRLVRVAVSVCFLATGGDALVDPDVLNDDFSAYLAAVNRRDGSSVKILHDRATSVRGSIGYTVGRPEAVLGRRAVGGGDASVDGDELRYQHQRSAHFHRYWVKDESGARRMVVKFVRQTTVRPDLPAKPDELSRPGSRTLRTESEMRQ